MRKVWHVIRFEIVTVLRRPSFLLFAFGLPLLAVLAMLGVSMVQGDAGSSPAGTGDATELAQVEAEGYIDPGGLVQVIPEDLPAGRFRPYPDEDAAKAALAAGEIVGYYLIPEDYVAAGGLVYVHPDANPFGADGERWPMRWLLTVNLLGGDEELASKVWTPMEVWVTALAPQDQRDHSSPATFYVPYATMMLMYFMMLMSSSLLLNSVAIEKQNRVMEILMSSFSPRELFAGKIVGLGILGLIQTVIWLGTAYGTLTLAGRTFDLPASLALPGSIWFWGVVFFLLGYAVYASLMAGLGALVPNLREGSQATFLVILPLLVPLFLISALVEDPNGTLAMVLSIFPLTAPGTMITRLAAGGVPAWQPPLAALLLLGAAILVLRAVSGMFQAQTLLGGEPFSPGRYLSAFLGRT